MIHVYHGDGKGKTTAAMGLALRMLAAGRRVVVVQFLKDGESGEARLLAEHFGVPVFAGKVSDKFTWSMTSEELAATCELHDGNLASALAELEGAQEGLLVLDEALAQFLQPTEGMRPLPAFRLPDRHHEIFPVEYLQRAE